MQFLERNLAALRRADPALADAVARCAPGPDLEVERARDGAPALSVGGRLECSLESPLAESRELAAGFLARAREVGARRLVLFGLPMHVLPRLAAFEGEVLLVEPRLDVLRAALEHVDVSAALDRVALIAGEDLGAVARHPLFRAPSRGLILAHAPARRRAGAFHDRLVARFDPGGSGGRLDIAVVPPLYGGSLPVARACVRALRALGHRVRELDLEPFWPAYQALETATSDLRLRPAGDVLRANLVRLIGEMLLASFSANPPDLVFALAQAPLDADTLTRIGRQGIPRALWFCEDFRVMRYWPGLARAYDVIFHLQPGEFEGQLRQAGGFGHPLPMAFDPELHRPLELGAEERARYSADVSFVGAAYHNRVQFLPALVPLGLRVWGTGWPALPGLAGCMPEPNRHQSSEDSNKIFNASKINLNLHSSPWTDGVNPVGDYLNPRTFELAGAGGFQLVDERSALRASFEPGCELETFRDLDECRRKIRHFLAHPDERLAMARAARTRALAEHTYAHRMQEALRVLSAGPVALRPRRDVQNSAGAALQAAASEPGLAAILGRLEPERELDGDAIRLAIARGNGPLARDELLLLYLREARGEVSIAPGTGAAA
jgi:spore maturation protein CgeB